MAKERKEKQTKICEHKTAKLRREGTKNVDGRRGKKENNLINCKKGMIMAKRVWAPETATCGATETARERARYGDRGTIGCTSQLNIV